MIDAVHGPPAWDGPDVLLRQTSFKALAEPRQFRRAGGAIEPGELRVRFGEVEQRGIALTTAGLALYEKASAEIAAHRRDSGPDQAPVGAIWRRLFPDSESGLERAGLGWFTVRVAKTCAAAPKARLSDLLDEHVLLAEPIVYEDFLPRSAAGIFRSNLTSLGTRDESGTSARYDIDRLSGIVEAEIHDPQDLYQAERRRSIADAAQALGITIEGDRMAPACARAAALNSYDTGHAAGPPNEEVS